MTSRRTFLGTDVGGTFSDLIYFDETGTIHCAKVPSTPSRPGASVMTGIDELVSRLELGPAELAGLRHTHSSTVATNALIERTGARVGLLTTSGFRDLLELQRLAVPHSMRYDSRRPAPPIPRSLVREIGGRLTADGDELEPLDEDAVVAAGRDLVAAGVAIAVVAFIHSYRNPVHERRSRDVLREAGVPLRVELSSEVWPQAREYERAILAAINAGIRPIVEGYVARLAEGLEERAIVQPARVARSNGGAELAETLRERPVVALLSGPAAGVTGAAAAAEDAGWLNADLMTLDVGGTSADIGVIRNGRPVLSSEEHIADFPVLMPTIAVSSIGAGGGSVIWLDAAGSLKVGPRSVGADPAPACYGVSDALIPALTDAFLVAGVLEADQALAGRLRLRSEPARAALARIADPLGWSIEEVADAAIRIATALMAAEAANVLALRGVDAPTFRMVAFGGAGPLLACLLAEEIAITTILVPPRPGALSALGAACANLEGDLVRPVYVRLSEGLGDRLASELARLSADAKSWIARQTGSPDVDALIEIAADMRYDGQGYDVTVPLAAGWLEAGRLADISDAFHAAHRRKYGHADPTAAIWLKELRAHIVVVVGKPPRLHVPRPDRHASETTRAVRLKGEIVEARILDRDALGESATVAGPAVIAQMDTTTLILPGWRGRVASSGSLILERLP